MTEDSSEPTYIEKPKHGRVLKKMLGRYFVHVDGRMVVCSISSKLRKELIYPEADPASIRPHVVSVKNIRTVDPVAVGDVVSFVDAGDGAGMITEVLPRKNKFSRRAPGSKSLEQVIAVNVDQVVAVFSTARPAPKWGLLDRYLANAESTGLPAQICITKMDLAEEARLRKEMRVYEQIGYPLVLTSARTARGVEAFKEALEGRVSVLVGKSGVGKTTLLNAIEPGLGLRVNEVSGATGKGKHTTSHLEMFELGFGGSVVDTPGMKEFGLWNVADGDVAHLFPEMRPYIGLCRFGLDCSHTHEPGCAIKEAVESGRVAHRRYRSYLSLRGKT